MHAKEFLINRWLARRARITKLTAVIDGRHQHDRGDGFGPCARLGVSSLDLAGSVQTPLPALFARLARVGRHHVGLD